MEQASQTLLKAKLVRRASITAFEANGPPAPSKKRASSSSERSHRRRKICGFTAVVTPSNDAIVDVTSQSVG
jgi:hypothetical protein